jgi:hypothetical protein
MEIQTSARRMIQRQVSSLEKMLNEKDKIAYHNWLGGDQADYLVLEDQDIAEDLEKWSLALVEVVNLEKDSSALYKLEQGLKSFKTLLNRNYE